MTGQMMGTSRNATTTLGDWGSRVQIPALRPNKPAENQHICSVSRALPLCAAHAKSEQKRTIGDSRGEKIPEFPPEFSLSVRALNNGGGPRVRAVIRAWRQLLAKLRTAGTLR
jgi:hypothetical protein